MKAVLEFFDASWLQILGYTLLHSVWQAFIVAAAVILALRFIPNRLSIGAIRRCIFGFDGDRFTFDRNFGLSQCHVDCINFDGEHCHASRYNPTSADHIHAGH